MDPFSGHADPGVFRVYLHMLIRGLYHYNSLQPKRITPSSPPVPLCWSEHSAMTASLDQFIIFSTIRRSIDNEFPSYIAF